MGVTLHKSGKWQAQVSHNKKNIYLGIYDNKEDAMKKVTEYIKTIPTFVAKSYVDNNELYKEIIYSKAIGSLTPKAFEMLYLMIKRISTKFRYKDNQDMEDVRQYAVFNLLKNWRNFNEDGYDDAFSYYTEIIKRSITMEYKVNISQNRRHISIESTFESGKLNI